MIFLNRSEAKEKKVCTKSCCHHPTEKKQNRNNPFGCCGNYMSNPFTNCCCCTGFIIEKQYYTVAPIQFVKETTFRNRYFVKLPYLTDCWHPPEYTCVT